MDKCYEGNLQKGQWKDCAHVDRAFSSRTNFTAYTVFTGFYFHSSNLSDVIGAHHYNFFLCQIIILKFLLEFDF